jgi:hypothetical protein
MRPGSRFGDFGATESGGARERGFPDLYSVLGQSDPLPPELERAFGQLLDGFHKLIRYMHRAFDRSSGGDESPAGESS